MFEQSDWVTAADTATMHKSDRMGLQLKKEKKKKERRAGGQTYVGDKSGLEKGPTPTEGGHGYGYDA